MQTVIKNANKLIIEKRAFINGKFQSAKLGKTINKTGSYNNIDLSGIAACEEEDINEAVKVAKDSFDSGIWREKTVQEKKRILLKLADLMEEHREELATLDTIETSRAYKNYYYDSIPKAIEALRYFAEGIDKYYDKAIPPQKDSFSFITRIPLGVVGIITPWNDPLVVSTWKFAPALLMGNSVVIKPAEQSSFSILKVAELTKKAGIPDGVFNVVTGYGHIAGKALALHKNVAGIFFTGSSVVGKKILEYSGQSNMKKVGLECGGKSPYIVSKNCKDISRAAKVLAQNIFYNQGQICSAPSRAIIDETIFDKFVECLKAESENFVPANPYDIKNEVGCVVNKDQFDKINNYIEYAKKNGEVYSAKTKNEMPQDACCIQPTIITGVDNHSKVAREEIFGPVVVVLKSKNIKDAINIANDTNYGLAGAIWTDDLNEAFLVANSIHAGIVHINSYGDDDNRAPFGGFKESGLGKDKSLYAFDEYSELKTVWVRIQEDVIL